MRASGPQAITERDQKLTRIVAFIDCNVVVAAAHISRLPVYVEFTKLDCRILLVEAREAADSPESRQ